MFIFCPVRDQPPKHYKDNLLRAKIKYVLFVFKTTPISRAYDSTTQTVYKAPGSGMARGELRSTLSRAGPLPLFGAHAPVTRNRKRKKTNFPFLSAFTIFAENGVFSKDEEMPAK